MREFAARMATKLGSIGRQAADNCRRCYVGFFVKGEFWISLGDSDLHRKLLFDRDRIAVRSVNEFASQSG